LPVYYAGNLQGRHVGETGEKGGLVVEAFPGGSAEPRFVPFAPVRWERVPVRDLSAAASIDSLAGDLARRIQALPRSPGEQLALRLELEGETPLASELRSELSLASLAEDVAIRSGALELELRAEKTSLPIDHARLRASPNVVATALELIDHARADDALLAALVPAELAHPAGEGEARFAYLRQLLEGLPDELLLRAVEREGA